MVMFGKLLKQRIAAVTGPCALGGAKLQERLVCGANLSFGLRLVQLELWLCCLACLGLFGQLARHLLGHLNRVFGLVLITSIQRLHRRV